MEQHKAYICMGSNMGDAGAHLAEALVRLGRCPGIRVEAVSPVYLTEPQNFREQPWFSNQVACLVCASDMTAEAFLDTLLGIESDMGRVRLSGDGSSSVARFGPRVIDLDVLLYDNEVRTGQKLTLPHPRMAERAFVLVPLKDIAPDLTLPDGRTPAEMLRSLAHAVEGNLIRQ